MELLQQMLERENLKAAFDRVKWNGGAAGPDGVTAKQLGAYLRTHWPSTKERILEGKYVPSPVRRATIPKPDGGERNLGIPNAIDRFIQQAMLQVLTSIFDRGFSESSFGFRPGRSAHQAVEQAQRYIEEGDVIVVDIDLEKFFDKVNHDILMSRVARKVKDKRMLKLIRQYLQAGIMVEGVRVASEEGTPQGSPLSPLLANIMLDELDKELEKRGHRFCRYADDCNIYVRTPKAGKRVMESVTRFLEKRLKLKVNKEKSAMGHPMARKFLGFTFMILGYGVDICISSKSIKRLKERTRELTNPVWPISIEERVKRLNRYLRGWLGYYALTTSPSILGPISAWMRRRLRSCIWQQWKRPRTRIRNLINLGVPRNDAFNVALSGKRDWRISRTPATHRALNNRFWENLGLVNLLKMYSELRQGW